MPRAPNSQQGTFWPIKSADLKDQPLSSTARGLGFQSEAILVSRDFPVPDIVLYGNEDAPPKTHNTKVFCFITSPSCSLPSSVDTALV